MAKDKKTTTVKKTVKKAVAKTKDKAKQVKKAVKAKARDVKKKVAKKVAKTRSTLAKKVAPKKKTAGKAKLRLVADNGAKKVKKKAAKTRGSDHIALGEYIHTARAFAKKQGIALKDLAVQGIQKFIHAFDSEEPQVSDYMDNDGSDFAENIKKIENIDDEKNGD